MELVRFLRSGEDAKKTAADHPVRAVAGLVSKMGSILVVRGNRIFVPRVERKRVLELLHSTHVGECTMWNNQEDLSLA